VSGFSRDSQLAVCPGCGDEMILQALRFHVCDWWRWLDHQVQLRRDELRRFEQELGVYLETPKGRFDLWYAARERGGAG